MTTVDPDAARDAADEILARPEFRERPRTLVSRALDWIGDRIGDVLGTILDGGRGLFFGYLVLALAIVAAVYFLWRFLPRGGRPDRTTPIDVTTEVRPLRTRDEWLAIARDAVAERRWADALHARYHALTTGLADADELSADPSTTSGEHRRAFAAVAAEAPDRRTSFNETVERYEEVWFGEASAGAPDVEAATRADEQVLRSRP